MGWRHVEARLPEPIEVAADYAASEALTNAAKRAHASVARSTSGRSPAACACRSLTMASAAPPGLGLWAGRAGRWP
jgi:hypothetical protein